LPDLSIDRRSSERCGRAIARPGAQENFRHANTDTASKKEDYQQRRDEREIADANTFAHFVPLGVTEKEGVAFTGGIAGSIAYSFTKKEKGGGGD